MSISTAKSYILKAARKSDEMLEPYEWKLSCTVLRRESGSNPADLVDYLKLFHATENAINTLISAQREAEKMFISDSEPEIKLVKLPEGTLSKNSDGPTL